MVWCAFYVGGNGRDSEKRNFAAMVLNRYGLPLYISTSLAKAGLADNRNLVANGMLRCCHPSPRQADFSFVMSDQCK